MNEIRTRSYTVETPNVPTLLSLPAELRAHILELIVFHGETDGMISPARYKPVHHCGHWEHNRKNAILVAVERGETRWEERFSIDDHFVPDILVEYNVFGQEKSRLVTT